MTLVYILVCVSPIVFILLVFGAIGIAAVKVGVNGKRLYGDFKPYISDLQEKGKRAQQMGLDFADRATKLQETFEEIGGRWVFIAETAQEARKSPLVKLANVAARFAGGGGED